MGGVRGLFCLLLVFNCVTFLVSVEIGEKKNNERLASLRNGTHGVLDEVPCLCLTRASSFSACFLGNEQGRKDRALREGT